MSTLPDLFSPTGLKVTKPLSYEDWSNLGYTLGTFTKATPWLVGDWYVMGEALFGEKSAQEISDGLGINVGTVSRYARVATQIPPVDRRASLSWYSHSLVAPLPRPARNSWLEQAEEGGWDSGRLRANLAAAKALPVRTEAGEEQRVEITAREALTMIRSDPVWRDVASAALDILPTDPVYEIVTCPRCKHQWPL